MIAPTRTRTKSTIATKRSMPEIYRREIRRVVPAGCGDRVNRCEETLVSALHRMRGSVDLKFRGKERPGIKKRSAAAGSRPYSAPKSFRINRYQSSIQ